jgi:hypothetical protein
MSATEKKTDASCKQTGHCMRGQIWSVDFFSAVIALSIIMLLFILVWNSLTQQISLSVQDTRMGVSAYFASESLLATPGEPESWEVLPAIDGNVSAIGLVNGRNELSRLKLEKLIQENASSYKTVKRRLGLERYDFAMQVTDLGGNKVYYEYGKSSNHSLNNSLEFDRLGILDNEPVIVHMEVWGG